MAGSIITHQNGGQADVGVARRNDPMTQAVEGLVAQHFAIHNDRLKCTAFHPFRLQAPENTGWRRSRVTRWRVLKTR